MSHEIYFIPIVQYHSLYQAAIGNTADQHSETPRSIPLFQVLNFPTIPLWVCDRSDITLTTLLFKIHIHYHKKF